jgi:predicted alpha-1,2-mannosidase
VLKSVHRPSRNRTSVPFATARRLPTLPHSVRLKRSRAAAGGLRGLAYALVLVLTLGIPAGVVAEPRPDLAAYVDPFIGTAPAPGTGYGLEFDGGDVFPGAVYPTGMLAWSPDTAETKLPGGYFYPDRTLKGFSLTHFSGRGCSVYQDVPLLPLSGSPGDPLPSALPTVSFSHANESAAPGFYAVLLDSGINVELTTTPRTGLGRLTFPASASTGTLLINAGGSVNGADQADVSIDPAQQLVTGHVVSQVGCGTDRYTLYFAIAFDRPFTAYADAGAAGSRMASVSFDTSQNHQVRLKPSISYVSVANAVSNLQTENPGWDVDAVRASARAAWNDVLDTVQVSGGSDANFKVFYTALYHTFLHPNLFSDANGDYLGFDDQVHAVAAGHAHYHNIPGWDQYRSLIQLRSILAPAQTSDIIQSLVDDAQQGGGGMPRWEQANRNSAGMVGDSPGAYIASAYAFGARDFDTAAALHALDLGASQPGTLSGGHPVREWLDPWVAMGYIPDQPSITLEYAADDFGIAQLASALGQSDLHTIYQARAAQWVNTFNPVTRYVEPRDAAGGFPNADHASACCGFVEGNAAQYTWMVPFDFPGLIHALGGNEAAVARLDDLFSEVNAGLTRPHAWIGNEPGLSTPWAYDLAAAPSRTQAVVRQIQTQAFSATPGGLPGNDDAGATSAWYVLSALGVYPAVPGAGGLAIGSPLFDDAIIRLSDGRTLHVVGHGAADTHPYVQSLLLDDAPYASTWIAWDRLSTGATLDFTLGASPSPWGT